MAIRGRLFRYIFSFILAFSILFLSIPLNTAAEEFGDVSADISSPVAENSIQTGTSIYRIPIEVPPGRRGIAPNIALVYNSAQGGGWAGTGWGLDMGSIQRSTKRGVNYNDNSYVAVINGSAVELVYRNDDWGPGYYSAKIEGAFFKFHHIITDDDNYWEVTAKDGSKYYYGRRASIYYPNPTDETIIANGGFNSEASRQTNPYYPQETGQIFKWLLDKVVDTNGNYMKITYENDKGSLYLQEIKYTGYGVLGSNDHIAPANKVVFTKSKDTNDVTRLTFIEVFADEDLVRKYDLFYNDSGDTGRPLLKEIYLYGSGTGSTERLISSFTYQGTPLSFEDPVDFLPSTSGKTLVSGDFNGDARSDIALINGSGVKVYLSQGGSFINDGEWISSVSSTYSCQPEEGCFTEYEGHSGDFDGDGKADLLVVIRHKDSEGNHIRYSAGGDYVPAPALVYYAEDSTFSAPLEFGNNPLASYSVGDVNGDGRADIVSGNSASLSQGRSFTGTVGCNFRFTLCLNSLNSTQTWAGDINGDGKSDVLIETTSVMLHYSSGDSLIPGPTIYNPTLNGNLAIGDFNGDGRADIVNVMSTGVNILLSEGKSFKTPEQWFDNSQDPATFALAGDFNGDGKSDLLVQGASGNAAVYYSKGGIPDLLKTVQNEIGGTTTITYKPSTQSSTQDSDDYLPYVVQTVSTIALDDGNDHVATKSFSYYSGNYDPAKREFRGFGKAVQTNPDGTRVESLFHQDDIFKGMPYNQKTYAPSAPPDNPFSETVNTYESVSPHTGVNFPRLIRKDDYLHDNAPSPIHTAVSFEYDDYGNVKRKYSHGEVITGQTTTGDEKTECVNFYYDLSKWMVSLPESTRIYEGDHVCGDSGEPKAKSEFTYYPDTGNLWTKTGWLNGGTNPQTKYIYDSYGNLTETWVKYGDGSEKKISTIIYDSTTKTYPYIVTNALDHASTTTYDYKYGKPRTKTDLNNNETTYLYDEFGRILEVRGPDYNSTSCALEDYFYEEFGTVGVQRVTSCKAEYNEAMGCSCKLTKQTYFDGFGRTIKTESSGPDNEVVVTDTDYDSSGRVLATSLPYFKGATSAQEITYSYDNIGRPKTVTSPDSPPAITTKEYSQLTTATIDAKGHKKEEVKDAYGRLAEVREYSGDGTSGNSYALYSTTRYTYDVLNNLSTVTDDAGNQTIIAYDTLSRKTSMTDPDMGHWSYTYDKNGNLETQTDAKDQIIYFQYDEINRIKQKDYGTKKPLDTNTGDIIYYYDQTAFTNPIGRLTTVSDQSGSTSFHYDKLGRTLTTIKSVNGITNPFIVQTGYDLFGRTDSLTYPDNEVVRYQYNTGSGIWNVTDDAGTYKYASYTGYNALGQVKTVTYGNHVQTDYTYYETNNRLETIKTALATSDTFLHLSYVYDSAGNIKSRINLAGDEPAPNIASASYDYTGYNCNQPHGPHAVTMVGTDLYCYDANGNMTGRGVQTITYNYDNMPVQIGNTTFVYDYAGQRVKKTTSSSTTVYIGKLYECTVDAGICVNAKKHIFAGTNRIATKTASDIFYFHSDHLGSSSVITNENGAKVQEIKYAAFGEGRYSFGNATNYKFTGQEEDPEIGLYYYGARYYDPALGKFISPDSIVQAPDDPQTLNRYAYCANNPLIYIDPTGHSFLTSFISGFVGGAVFVLSGGTAAPFILPHLMAAGMAAGATSGALNGGGLEGIITGAVTGGLSGAFGGAIVGLNPAVMGPAMLIGGATYAGATGGLNGLVDFAGGILGFYVGLKVTPYVQNVFQGYGVKSNNSVIDTLYKEEKYQEAIDFGSKRYGYPPGEWAPDDPYLDPKKGYASYTDPTTGKVKYGWLTFAETSNVQASGYHEGRHVYQVETKQDKWVGDYLINRNFLEMDACKQTIRNAFFLDLTESVIQKQIEYYNFSAEMERQPLW